MAGGGIESMICALANEMSKSEEVTVCSIFNPKPTDTFWFKLNSNVSRKTLGKIKSGFSFRILWSIYRFIRSGNYDVVNLHGMFYYYILSVIFLFRKTKFFYTVHSDAIKENTIWDKRLLPFKKCCFTKGWVHPITISNISQDSFSKLYHASSTLIYNGVPRPIIMEYDPVSPYRITPNTKVFIHVGRISLPKNQLTLCKVFNQLILEGNDIVLLIAGQRQSEEIFNGIKTYFNNRIVYLGQRSDITQLMAYSDGMCLPSIWEGLPVTLLESLSVGCIPICSNVGGISNVIKTGVNGFLSKTPSEDDYYKVLKDFLNLSSDELVSIRKTCKESFSRYDIENASRLYLHTYKQFN